MTDEKTTEKGWARWPGWRTVAEWRVAIDERARMHTATCSMTGVRLGHPHRDCYCDVYWNDDEPKFECPDCPTD